MVALSPPQAPGAPTTAQLLARNGALPLLSFVASGLTNMAAQRFFAPHPEAPEWALSLMLVVGTVGSMAGVAAARRAPRGARTRRTGAALVLTVVVLTLGLFQAASVALYAVVHTAVRLLCNAATHLLDERAVAAAGAGGRAANDRVGTALRFVGMLVGPLWLGLVAPSSVSTAVCVGALGAAALWANARLPAEGAEVAAVKPLALPPEDRWVAASGVAIYATYYLLASSALGLVTRQHPSADGPMLAGLMISAVYGCAIVATVVMGKRGVVPPLRWMGAAPLLMAVCAAGLCGGAHLPSGVLAAGAATLGVAFAGFMLAFRNHATARARQGVDGFVAVFNNLGNASALLGFGVMHALVMARIHAGGSADAWLGAGLMALALLGAGLLAAGVAAHRRIHVPPGTETRPGGTNAGRTRTEVGP